MKFRRKKRQSRTHAVALGCCVALVCCVFVLVNGVAGAIGVMDSWCDDLPTVSDADFAYTAQKSVMYASDGTTKLAEFQLEKRNPVSQNEVSNFVKQATIDTEDVRFYSHNGVDTQGILRAALNNIAGGSREGGSTITMQLVRNTVLSQEATDISAKRKIREARLALDIEEQYSKDEILLMYLNTVNYGDGCYGIEAAAQNYFQTSAANLTLVQAATLAGIPQSPTNLNPKVYPEACKNRRNAVLGRMLSASSITQAEYDNACAEPLNLNAKAEAPEDGIYAYPYFTSYVRNLLMETDNQFGCNYANLFEGGLTIYTTLDVNMQNSAENACANQRARMSESLDCSIVAVDPTNGYVKALVGGADFSSNQVNMATGEGGSGRQAGSTFKAFTLAAAIEVGINPKTRIDCTSPMTKNVDGIEQSFENFDNANYGVRTIKSATAVSANTGFLRLSEAIGPSSIAQMAKRLGVVSQVASVYTTTLGVASVTPLEMANAYATFANGGTKHESVAVTKIVNKNGAVLYEANTKGETAISSEVAGATTSVLREVFEASDGTAQDAKLASGQPAAGKTGTSTNFADHWLVGYTPTLSCATWIGNPEGSIQTASTLNCNTLWKEFMDGALEGSSIQQFPTTSEPAYNNEFNDKQKAQLGSESDDNSSSQNSTQSSTPTQITQGSLLGNTSSGSQNSSSSTTPPDATGKTLDEAKKLLRSWKAGSIEEKSTTVQKGTVIRQYVASDGMIVVVVSSGS